MAGRCAGRSTRRLSTRSGRRDRSAPCGNKWSSLFEDPAHYKVAGRCRSMTRAWCARSRWDSPGTGCRYPGAIALHRPGRRCVSAPERIQPPMVAPYEDTVSSVLLHCCCRQVGESASVQVPPGLLLRCRTTGGPALAGMASAGAAGVLRSPRRAAALLALFALMCVNVAAHALVLRRYAGDYPRVAGRRSPVRPGLGHAARLAVAGRCHSTRGHVDACGGPRPYVISRPIDGRWT